MLGPEFQVGMHRFDLEDKHQSSKCMAVYKAQHLMTVYQVLGLGWGEGKARKAQGSGASYLGSTFL